MKRAALFVVCLGALLLLLGGCGPALGENYDPIYVSASCSPKSISGPKEVDVTIIVTNQADAELTVPVTLYDPNGNQVSFSGNVTTLGAQQKATYTGKWSVSADELASGKIKYKLSYNQLDENRNPIGYSRVVPVAISKAAATSKLTASYSISPNPASKGQTVTLTYTLSNTGSADIVDVTITNTSLNKEKVFISRIAAGDKVTKTFEYTMGSKAVKSKPRVTYKIDGNKDVKTLTNIGTKTIELEKGGIVVNLKAKGSTDVEPGTKVDLTLSITNSSNVTYTDVKISDPLLGDIATGIELKANGGKYSETKTVPVNETADYAFHVTGKSESGKELDLTSNIVRLVALDMTKRLQLSVEAVAQSTEIFIEPAEVVFEITVKNTGQSTGNKMELKHGKTTIANIGALAPGEERVFVKRLLVSMAGKFMFSVTGTNEQGSNQTIDGNTVQVAYVEPTPEPPPPTPEPTDAPLQETTVPLTGSTKDESNGNGAGMTLLWVIAGVLIMALAAVMGMIVVGRRRQAVDHAQSEEAIDSIQRGARRDYAASPHRPAQSSQRARRPEPQDYEDDDVADDRDYAPQPSHASGHQELGLASNASMHELASLYGRPEDEEEPPRSQPRKRARDTQETANAYLARMREPSTDREYSTLGEQADYRRRRRVHSVDA